MKVGGDGTVSDIFGWAANYQMLGDIAALHADRTGKFYAIDRRSVVSMNLTLRESFNVFILIRRAQLEPQSANNSNHRCGPSPIVPFRLSTDGVPVVQSKW